MKEKLIYILCVFSAVITYGQVTLGVTDVKNPTVNQRFNLTVLLEISGENMEQETPLRMPDLSKFEIIGSASEQNTIVVDSKKGDVVNQMVYQWVLSPKEAGKIKFGSVLVTVNGKIYKTEPFDIYVKETEKNSSLSENKNVNSGLSLSLELQDKTVYRNEPAVALLRAYSRDYGNFRKVSSIQISPQKNASVKQVSFTKSEIEMKSGMASQVIGKFIIFPNESGDVEINSLSATLSNNNKPLKISSNRVKLKVKKLPVAEPANFKNAVGNFDIAVKQNNITEISEVEKPINVSLRISGAGNFGDFQLPTIMNSADYAFFTPKMSANTSPKSIGLSGDIIADYVVIPKKSGLVTINFENFCYFDPSAKEYVNLGEKSVVLNVKTHNEIADAKSTIEKVNDYTNIVLETVNTPVLQTHNFKIKDKDKINWNIVFGNLGLMAAVLTLFLFVQKKNEARKLQPKVAVKTLTSIAETEEHLRKIQTHELAENIAYLQKLKDEGNFQRFFAVYDELKSDIKKYLQIDTESHFKKYIEKHKGSGLLDQYNLFSENIQIEKFAPFHTDEHIEELFQSINYLYNEIVK